MYQVEEQFRYVFIIDFKKEKNLNSTVFIFVYVTRYIRNLSTDFDDSFCWKEYLNSESI